MKKLKVIFIMSTILLVSIAAMARPAEKKCVVGDDSCFHNVTPASTRTQTSKCPISGILTRVCSIGETICYATPINGVFCQCYGQVGACSEKCGAWTGKCGICVPGAKEVKACPTNGQQERVCTGDGLDFNAWSACPPQIVCPPNTSMYETCDTCGTRQKTCAADGTAWGGWGACQQLR